MNDLAIGDIVRVYNHECSLNILVVKIKTNDSGIKVYGMLLFAEYYEYFERQKKFEISHPIHWFYSSIYESHWVIQDENMMMLEELCFHEKLN